MQLAPAARSRSGWGNRAMSLEICSAMKLGPYPNDAVPARAAGRPRPARIPSGNHGRVPGVPPRRPVAAHRVSCVTKSSPSVALMISQEFATACSSASITAWITATKHLDDLIGCRSHGRLLCLWCGCAVVFSGQNGVAVSGTNSTPPHRS